MTDHATRYACRSCDTSKFVPERPLDAAGKIRTGCETCGAIMPHHPVGHPAGATLTRGWRA